MSLRFGLVGAGNIAQAYLQLFGDLDDAEIVGVVDVRPAAAATAADRVGARPYGTVEELLDVETPDAIIVCTPPETHPDVALAAIERRVAVLCEKPLATRIGPAQTMMAAAKAAGVPLTMATKFRFVDDVVHAQRLVAAGALGALIQIENRFASRVDMASRWNSDPAVSGGGVLIDNGTHSVDIARSFLGPIHEVLVIEGPRVQALEVEDSVQVLLRAASGATATIDLSWSYDHATDAYLELYGSAGVLRVGWHGSELRANDADEWTRIGEGYDKITCMRAQMRNFCAALRGEEPMRITDADAIASVQVIDACYRSLTLGDWTPVELVQPIARAGGDVAQVEARVHPTAAIEPGVELGAGTTVWAHVHLRGPATRLGVDCIVGERTYVAYGVQIGDRVKLNAGVYVCTGVTLGTGVLVGAGVVFTNDRYPRATTPDLATLRPSEPDARTLPTVVEEGATIGAGSVVGCDLTIGRFAMVGMGAVVTRSVAPFHLVVGQPARPVAIVSRAGEPLMRFSGARPPDREGLVCPTSGLGYAVRGGVVEELDPP